MNTTNLEQTLEKLIDEIRADLIKTLRDKGHKGQGKLEKSIKINLKKENEGYIIDLNTNQYLIYLDEGKFYKDWSNKINNKIANQIGDAIMQDIITDLDLI